MNRKSSTKVFFKNHGHEFHEQILVCGSPVNIEKLHCKKGWVRLLQEKTSSVKTHQKNVRDQAADLFEGLKKR